jgi:hypothetical protein
MGILFLYGTLLHCLALRYTLPGRSLLHLVTPGSAGVLRQEVVWILFGRSRVTRSAPEIVRVGTVCVCVCVCVGWCVCVYVMVCVGGAGGKVCVDGCGWGGWGGSGVAEACHAPSRPQVAGSTAAGLRSCGAAGSAGRALPGCACHRGSSGGSPCVAGPWRAAYSPRRPSRPSAASV